MSPKDEKDSGKKAPVTREDETNWFGNKIGLEKNGLGGSSGGGIGKYLNLNSTGTGVKRPADAPAVVATPDDSKKRRKIGFGNFEGW